MTLLVRTLQLGLKLLNLQLHVVCSELGLTFLVPLLLQVTSGVHLCAEPSAGLLCGLDHHTDSGQCNLQPAVFPLLSLSPTPCNRQLLSVMLLLQAHNSNHEGQLI